MASAFWWFVEYVRAGSLCDTPELAVAGFSGLVAVRGRDGIDGGNDCFGDAVFGGGDFGGPIGSGGFGTYGGNSGYDASVLCLGEARSAISVPSSCFLFDPGCVNSGWTLLVPSCTISTSASPTSVSQPDLVSGIFRGFVRDFVGLASSNSGTPPRARFQFHWFWRQMGGFLGDVAIIYVGCLCLSHYVCHRAQYFDEFVGYLFLSLPSGGCFDSKWCCPPDLCPGGDTEGGQQSIGNRCFCSV